MKDAAMAYLNKLPNANSGDHGHNATLAAALACKRFGLSQSETWEAMQWFNDNRCTPRWSEKELRHKIDSVADVAIKKPLGKRTTFKQRRRAFVAPAAPVRKIDTRPICRQSEQEEQLWWEKVAAERGVDLGDWDNPQGGNYA